MISIESAYYELWDKKPPCLSEEDIFKMKMNPPKPKIESRQGFADLLDTPGATMRSGIEPSSIMVNKKEDLDMSEQKSGEIARKSYNVEVHGLKLKLAAMSCLLCSDKQWLRNAFIWIVFWKHTNTIIYLMIITNSIFLGIYNYKEEKDFSNLNFAVRCYVIS